MRKFVAVLVATIMVIHLLAAETTEAVDVRKLQQQVSRFEQQLTSQNQQFLQQITNMHKQWAAEKKELKQEINQLYQHIEKLEEENSHTNQFQNKVENLLGKVTHDNQNLRHLVEKHKHRHGSVIGFSAFASAGQDYNAGDIVQFDGVITNEGNLYSPLTSTFMCEFPSHYIFSINIKTDDFNPMLAEIEIGGETVAAAVWAFDEYDAASNTVIVSCPQNAEVLVRTKQDGCSMRGDPSAPVSTFTGILLYGSE